MRSYYKYYYNEELLGILDKETITKKFKEMYAGDITAKEEIINRNLALVMSIAKKYSSSYDKVEDLISIGAIGLIKAVNTFDIDKGIIFATYARKCIENEILMDYRKNKKYRNDISFNTPIKINKDGHQLLIEDILEDFDQDFVSKYEDQILYKEIREFVEQLPEREKYIIKMLFGFNKDIIRTQQELESELGISQSYISRIKKKVLKKLSIHLKEIEEVKREEQPTSMEDKASPKIKVLSGKNSKAIKV